MNVKTGITAAWTADGLLERTGKLLHDLSTMWLRAQNLQRSHQLITQHGRWKISQALPLDEELYRSLSAAEGGKSVLIFQ